MRRLAPAPRLVAAVAVGGAVGAVLRHTAQVVAPTGGGGGFPWTVLAINVVGAALLALLPALAAVRRSPVLAAGLGPGLLGGFTTLSAASEDTRVLLAADRPVLAGAYLVGTLAACLLAVTVVSLLAPPAAQDSVAAGEGDG